MKKISIIVPCYNESANLQELHERVQKTFNALVRPHEFTYELLFIDNASTDNSHEIYKTIIAQDSQVRVLCMARNFGTSQTSFFAGLQHATGDAVVLIEGDLQDPPELIPKLIKKWEDGFDVVYAVRKKRRGTPIRKIFYKCFYFIFRHLSYIKMPLDAGDFSLIDRKVVDIIKKLPEKDIYIRGLRAWAGFRQTGVEYVRDARAHGKTSIRFFANFTWAKKAIVNFSYKPLEYISKLTVAVATLTIVAAGIYLYLAFKTNMPRGFPTLLMVMFIFGTIQLLSLSIIGEYLIRMFQEIKNRPPYILSHILEHDQKTIIAKKITPIIKEQNTSTYLVTGGNGFIGSNLVRELIEKAAKEKNLFVLTEPNPNLEKISDLIDRIKIIPCDVTNKDYVLKTITSINPDHVFHLAAVGIKPGQANIKNLFDINFHGTVNVLEACKKTGFSSFINTGTASEYGNKNEPLKETLSLEPQDEYSLSKVAATLYCQQQAKRHNLPIYTVRPFCVYGDGEPSHRLIPTIIQNYLEQKTIDLSSPENVRDFIYVKDLVDFYMLLSERTPEENIFNVGTGKEHSIGQVVQTFEEIIGKKLDIRWNRVNARPWEFKTWQADTARTEKVLGWKTKHSLHDGLEQTLTFARGDKKKYYANNANKENKKSHTQILEQNTR